MEFKLTTTRDKYKPDEATCLECLGFKFNPVKTKYSDIPLVMRKTRDSVEIEISTLEELINLTESYGEIVLSKGQIEIYDGYH